MIGIIDRNPSREKQFRSAKAPGRPNRRLAGGWVADLAALGKAIVLCDFCVRKFNAKACGYKARRVVPYSKYVIGDCDGCKRPNQQATMFLKER